MTKNEITIGEYLTQKGIEFKEINGELISACFFNGCDEDSGSNERHLYFSEETGQYHCKKCGAKGNLKTLMEHFGDDMHAPQTTNLANTRISKKLDPAIVEQCHNSIPVRIREYLHSRDITDEIISEQHLGWGNFYGKNWITIPITNIEGKYEFLKLRRDPEDKNNKNKYMFFPAGSQATIYGWENLTSCQNEIVICEGEFDRLILSKFAIPAITSTAGAGTFKKEWLEHLRNLDKIYVAFDRDKVGETESERLIKVLAENLPEAEIYKIKLPERMTDGKDITDYFIRYDGNVDEFIYKLPEWKAGAEPIDKSKFVEMGSEELMEVLGLTIKKDDENKIIAFLCMLSAYTEDAQFNISFNAPSSTGKSYIPTQICKLFPKRDVMELAQCSPTALFHDRSEWDKERKIKIVDLSKKIIIFLDQPHNELLARLRPILSHDEKEVLLKITDKSNKSGINTKNIIVKGYPSVIFCTASLKIDEQEGTRAILLSPETSQEKIREGIIQAIFKSTDNEAYQNWLESDPNRKLLKERVKAIAQEKIDNVKIIDKTELERIFLDEKDNLKPRHQRDINKLVSIIKAFALLNMWFRERKNNILIASDTDIEEGVKLWEKISESQDYNLPPFIFNLFREVILVAWNENDQKDLNGAKLGLTRQTIINKYYEVYKRSLDNWLLRQQILPMLQSCGLISQERHPVDKRKFLVYPSLPLANSPENNSERNPGGIENVNRANNITETNL